MAVDVWVQGYREGELWTEWWAGLWADWVREGMVGGHVFQVFGRKGGFRHCIVSIFTTWGQFFSFIKPDSAVVLGSKAVPRR